MAVPSLKVVTPPAVEVCSLADAKAQLRVDFGDDDSLIARKLAAARELCEAEVSRAFVTTAFRLTMDAFPGMQVDPRRPLWALERPSPGPLLAIRLPRCPVLAVSAVRYVATDGTLTTLDPSVYAAATGDDDRLMPAYSRTWPATRFQPGAVTVDFTAGYGADASFVPAVVVEAVLITLTSLYYNRGSEPSEVPPAARSLLAAEDWGAYG